MSGHGPALPSYLVVRFPLYSFVESGFSFRLFDADFMFLLSIIIVILVPISLLGFLTILLSRAFLDPSLDESQSLF